MPNYEKVSPSSGDGNYEKEPSWKPEEMPELEGVYYETKENVGNFHKTIWKVRTEAGDPYTIWESKMLKGLMSEVPLGSQIKIVFLGMKATKNGSGRYKDFDLFVATGVDAGSSSNDVNTSEQGDTQLPTEATANEPAANKAKDDYQEEVPF